MRSCVGGCVENNFANHAPLIAGMMYMCDMAGVADSIGMRFDQVSSFASPEIKPSGVPVYLAAA